MCGLYEVIEPNAASTKWTVGCGIWGYTGSDGLVISTSAYLDVDVMMH